LPMSRLCRSFGPGPHRNAANFDNVKKSNPFPTGATIRPGARNPSAALQTFAGHPRARPQA
jgi:hypothetical protein